MTITAKYEDGVFKPREEVRVREGTIVEVRLPQRDVRPHGKTPSVGKLAFFGMWKDRTDIGDSVEYVNRLRQTLRS